MFLSVPPPVLGSYEVALEDPTAGAVLFLQVVDPLFQEGAPCTFAGFAGSGKC